MITQKYYMIMFNICVQLLLQLYQENFNNMVRHKCSFFFDNVRVMK